MKRSVRTPAGVIEYILFMSARGDVLLRAPEPGKLRVYAPKWAKLRDIDAIVKQKSGDIREMWRGFQSPALADGARILIEGKPHTVKIATGRPEVVIAGDIVRISAPTPESARAILIERLAHMALERVRDSVIRYADGAQFGRVTIRAQRTRWGSCSSKRNLNFNWKLILAPSEALNYVVIHELAHLQEFNHSPRFWKLVESKMPDYEYWRKWLKTNGARLTF